MWSTHVQNHSNNNISPTLPLNSIQESSRLIYRDGSFNLRTQKEFIYVSNWVGTPFWPSRHNYVWHRNICNSCAIIKKNISFCLFTRFYVKRHNYVHPTHPLDIFALLLLKFFTEWKREFETDHKNQTSHESDHSCQKHTYALLIRWGILYSHQNQANATTFTPIEHGCNLIGIYI